MACEVHKISIVINGAFSHKNYHCPVSYFTRILADLFLPYRISG
jgi:hypothetical protein